MQNPLKVFIYIYIYIFNAVQLIYIYTYIYIYSMHFKKLVLPFLGMQMIDRTLPLEWLAWFLCLTFKPMSHRDRQPLSLNGILSLFPTSLEGPGKT